MLSFSIEPKIGCVLRTLNEWVKRDEIADGVREDVTRNEARPAKALDR
jgi:hypothetical protein